MRGRKPDAPGLQQAKGNPGRRRSAVQKRLDEAERVAEMLARAPAQGDPLAPPSIIEQGAEAAVAVWRDLAPRLRSTQRLQPQHRPMFALFCVYFAEWVLANEDIKKNGHTQSVKTVAGGRMERTRPIVAIRDRAFDMVMKLSERFGLTPSDEYSLFREQAVAFAANPGLFDREHQPQQKADAEAETPGDGEGQSSLIGALDRMDSKPPTLN
ncbi:P27 family phage terminase small subunit [Sphingosinithalassobacter portus]|uniref:P27 family phage terminase small subunit n=1 Tax=Stakelama portus TaxID=2676234 RepID=UPI00137B823A|nr:P27 family phage terminase small subunit [Sphingosinithalassobacter portus]